MEWLPTLVSWFFNEFDAIPKLVKKEVAIIDMHAKATMFAKISKQVIVIMLTAA